MGCLIRLQINVCTWYLLEFNVFSCLIQHLHIPVFTHGVTYTHYLSSAYGFFLIINLRILDKLSSGEATI